MKDLFIGIDLGTSAMKLVLIDKNRNVLAQDIQKYQVSMNSDGWSEIDQELWYTGMVHGLKNLLRGQDASRLCCIGITGQMHTLVILDQEGKAIRPALMWNDLRSAALIPELRERLEDFEEGDYLGRIVSTGSPLANLYWLKQNEPEHYRRIGKFLIGPDYLVYRLTGTYGTDYCEASTSCLYEIGRRRWSPQIRKFLELDSCVYPTVRGSAVPAGFVGGELASWLGIPEDVKVLTGTGDNVAAALSTGCFVNHRPLISLGTSGVLIVPVEESWNCPYGKRILFSLDDQHFFHLIQGTVQANGTAVNWWSSQIMGRPDYTYIDKHIDLEKEKSNPVIFYPHLAGEKTLYADSSLRGAFVGLNTDVSKENLAYAMLEGICFAFRELSERLQLPLKTYEKFQVVGGGTNSRIWLQTLANVLNINVEKIDGMIGVAFGIAVLAASAGDKTPEDGYEKTVLNSVNAVSSFVPDLEMAQICMKKYQVYCRMHDGLKYITEGLLPKPDQ